MSKFLKKLLILLSITIFIFLVFPRRNVSSENNESIKNNKTRAPFLGKKYLGIDVCETCHPGKVKKWETTVHSNAFNLLETMGQDQNDTCLRCHTTGFNLSIKNKGYDEKRKEKLVNVQCEACHGPGASLVGHRRRKESSSVPYVISYSDACGYCHTQTVKGSYSKGQFDQWKNSVHKKVLVGCQSCHFPHSAENSFQLKYFGNIELANGKEINADVAAVCMNCHSDSIKNASFAAKSKKNPEKPQAEMFSGTGGVEYEGETYNNSFHTTDNFKVGNGTNEKCITCHMFLTPDKGTAGHNTVGQHSFAMRDKKGNININACYQCHSPSFLPSFEGPTYDYRDYDEDGTVEGVQTEIEGLLDKLKYAITSSGNVTFSDYFENPKFSISKNATLDEKKAVFNWFFVYNDGSKGIHNTAYAAKLLQVSYKKLTE